MTLLKTQYTDSKHITHLVQHETVSLEHGVSREQILADLAAALLQPPESSAT